MYIPHNNNAYALDERYTGLGKTGGKKKKIKKRAPSDSFTHSTKSLKEMDLGKKAYALKSKQSQPSKKTGRLSNILKGGAIGALLGGVAAVPFLLATPFTMLAVGAVGTGAILGGTLSLLEGSGGSGGASDNTSITNMQTTLRTLNMM